jgi:hypothetical protein
MESGLAFLMPILRTPAGWRLSLRLSAGMQRLPAARVKLACSLALFIDMDRAIRGKGRKYAADFSGMKHAFTVNG